MRDAGTGRHQVEFACTNQLFGAEAVAVHHFPGGQPGEGVHAAVRVRSDVDAVLGYHGHGSHVVG